MLCIHTHIYTSTYRERERGRGVCIHVVCIQFDFIWINVYKSTFLLLDVDLNQLRVHVQFLVLASRKFYVSTLVVTSTRAVTRTYSYSLLRIVTRTYSYSYCTRAQVQHLLVFLGTLSFAHFVGPLLHKVEEEIGSQHTQVRCNVRCNAAHHELMLPLCNRRQDLNSEGRGFHPRSSGGIHHPSSSTVPRQRMQGQRCGNVSRAHGGNPDPVRSQLCAQRVKVSMQCMLACGVGRPNAIGMCKQARIPLAPQFRLFYRPGKVLLLSNPI